MGDSERAGPEQRGSVEQHHTEGGAAAWTLGEERPSANVGRGRTGRAESSRSRPKGDRVLAMGRTQNQKVPAGAACAVLCWTRWGGQALGSLSALRPPWTPAAQGSDPGRPLLSQGPRHRPGTVDAPLGRPALAPWDRAGPGEGSRPPV